MDEWEGATLPVLRRACKDRGLPTRDSVSTLPKARLLAQLRAGATAVRRESIPPPPPPPPAADAEQSGPCSMLTTHSTRVTTSLQTGAEACPQSPSRKRGATSTPEKRLKRYRPEPNADVRSRISRALSQRLFLVHQVCQPFGLAQCSASGALRSRMQDCLSPTSRVYTVLGTTGNVYKARSPAHTPMYIMSDHRATGFSLSVLPSAQVTIGVLPQCDCPDRH
jgi:hypothetical protein